MPLETDVAYHYPYCHEESFLGVDPSGGTRQRLVEDCPVCCRPIVFSLHIDREGEASLDSVEPES